MTEQDRQSAIAMALGYWLPTHWENSGSWYKLVGYEFTGDIDSGGVDVTVEKDGAASAVVSFTNDDCYGGSILTASAAKSAVYGGTYS